MFKTTAAGRLKIKELSRTLRDREKGHANKPFTSDDFLTLAILQIVFQQERNADDSTLAAIQERISPDALTPIIEPKVKILVGRGWLTLTAEPAPPPRPATLAEEAGLGTPSGLSWRFTQDDVDVLLKNYPPAPATEPAAPQAATPEPETRRRRAKSNDLKHWYKRAFQYIRNTEGEISISEVARLCGVNKSVVSRDKRIKSLFEKYQRDRTHNVKKREKAKS
jgi:hypothetical protein